MSPLPRSAFTLGVVAALLSACTTPPAAAPAAPPLAEIATPAAPPHASAAPEEPLPSREDAIAQGRALAAAWPGMPREKRAGWLRERAVDETTLRRILAAIAKPCLAERDGAGAACKQIIAGETGVIFHAVLDGLAAIADPAPPGSPTLRLLIALDARGQWQAGRAIDRALERRASASNMACTPPTPDEVAAARRSLADFAVLDGAADGRLVARWPSAEELNDLAYFHAVVAGSGPAIGAVAEDDAAKPLPGSHPDLARRKELRDELRASLLDGDVARHLRVAETYLATLGYPGPLRLAEEGDARWGGAGVSFVMRDAARSAEILGRYDLAEALYRRANPGGGMCGTSTPMRVAEQIGGALRAAEQRAGCRAAAAERLFAIDSDDDVHGPTRLAQAGFDVARAYAGAMLTAGRDDREALERALDALPSGSRDATQRLARLGTEAWSTRVRAIPGYADTAKAAGLDRLLALAAHGPAEARAEAVDAIGRVAEDHGDEPCIEDGFGWLRGSSLMPREVHSVMTTCATRLPARTIAGVVRRLAALAADRDPRLRETVAIALGRLGSPLARPTLRRLARDTFDGGGTVCISHGNGPRQCEPNRPVHRAAKEALEELANAEATRAKQRKARAK